MVRRTTHRRAPVDLVAGEHDTRAAEDPVDLGRSRWCTTTVVAASSRCGQRRRASDLAEILVAFVHVAGDELRDAGAFELVELVDLAAGGLVAEPLHVAPDVRGVVEGGEVGKDTRLRVSQQHVGHWPCLLYT